MSNGINVYGDVIANNLIQNKKKKYTMADVYNVVNNSLFNPVNGQSIDIETAIFIVKCSAVFHNTEYADSLNKRLDNLRKYPTF